MLSILPSQFVGRQKCDVQVCVSPTKTQKNLIKITEKDENMRIKQFTLDLSSKSGQLKIEEIESVEINEDQNILKLNGGVKGITQLFLPTGYPDSITPDYVEYQLWTLPAHITGWQSMALATSSLLKAVGVGTLSPVMATAAGAAIKWITKDGIGATGRLIVGGKLSSVFDKDPKLWRMLAEFSSSFGMTLEILTAIMPQYFLLLAGVGNLAKAVGRGMGQPAFRVIQTHFAAKVTSVGDVAAKEEVWEVAGQLLGLAYSIATLTLLEKSPQFETLFATWVASRTFHVWLRYNSLKKLQLNTINHKRACLLCTRFVAGKRSEEFLGIKIINQAEEILQFDSFCTPRICFGVSLDFALKQCDSNLNSNQLINQCVQQFQQQDFLLIQTRKQSYVILKSGYSERNIIKSVLLSAILNQKSIADNFQLEFSDCLIELESEFGDFMRKLDSLGWNTSQFLFLNSGNSVMIE